MVKRVTDSAGWQPKRRVSASGTAVSSKGKRRKPGNFECGEGPTQRRFGLQAHRRHSDGKIVDSWTTRFIAAGFVAHPTDAGRVDMPRTTTSNELVKRHVGGDTPCVPEPLRRLVASLLYPLHNFLQLHWGLDNADELQLLVYPASTATPPPRSGGIRLSAAYLATNQEKVTQEQIDRALAGWAVPAVYGLNRIELVSGTAGRHAEQKLIDFAVSQQETAGTRKDDHLLPVVVGERLPCAACRLYAANFEHVVATLPSHGHLYRSTFSLTPGVSEMPPEVAFELLADGRTCTTCPADTVGGHGGGVVRVGQQQSATLRHSAQRAPKSAAAAKFTRSGKKTTTISATRPKRR